MKLSKKSLEGNVFPNDEGVKFNVSHFVEWRS